MQAAGWTLRRVKLMGFAVLFLLLLVGTGCAGTLKGQVLDAQTGQPIEGAVVLGVWTKYSGLPGLQYGELAGVKETETDVDGRFVLETAGSLGAEEAVTIYKSGYVAWSNLFMFPTSERRQDIRVPSRIMLERFPPGQSHQRHVDFISGARRAGMGYGRESIPKFWNALQRELDMP